MFHWFSLWEETTKNGDYQFFYVLYIMFCNNWMIFCYIIMTIIHLYMINTINALWHIVLINSDSHESSRRPFPISTWSNQISGHMWVFDWINVRNHSGAVRNEIIQVILRRQQFIIFYKLSMSNFFIFRESWRSFFF